MPNIVTMTWFAMMHNSVPNYAWACVAAALLQHVSNITLLLLGIGPDGSRYGARRIPVLLCRSIPLQVIAGHSFADVDPDSAQLLSMDSVVDPEDPITRPPWGEYGRVCTLGLVSLVSKFVFNVWNTTQINNQAELLKHVQHRSAGQGLITVSNHTRQAQRRCAGRLSCSSLTSNPHDMFIVFAALLMTPWSSLPWYLGLTS